MPYQQWQFALAMRGLAILRTGQTATDADLAEHLDALSDPAAATNPVLIRIIGGPERDVASGYELWSSTYDAPGNPLIGHEQPVVHEILARWPAPLRVLDAACGTGRHTSYLAELGHEVTGVDASPWMLAQAEKKRPDLTLLEGRIDALPFPDADFDAAVCSLLFDHLPRIDRAIGELARVVRPGGRIVISNLHPTMALIGAHAAFRDVDDNPYYIRSHHHSVSTYFECFREHGLTVVRCEEPSWTVASAKERFPFISDSVARDAVAGLPMALVWELTA